MKLFVVALSLSLASFAYGDLEVRPNGLGVDIIDKPGRFISIFKYCSMVLSLDLLLLIM